MDTNSIDNSSKQGIYLMLLSAIAACIGQLFWKIYALYSGLYWLLLGGFLYVVGALLMIVAYRFGKLSVLQPLLSISYALSMLIGYLFLGERLTLVNIFGGVCIICGVVLIAKSK